MWAAHPPASAGSDFIVKARKSLINARAETLAVKPAFGVALRKRRCLVVADGFYEWQRGRAKQPIYIVLKGREPFGFAGLWETWTAPNGEEIRSCTFITTEANELLRPIHDACR